MSPKESLVLYFGKGGSLENNLVKSFLLTLPGVSLEVMHVSIDGQSRSSFLPCWVGLVGGEMGAGWESGGNRPGLRLLSPLS